MSLGDHCALAEGGPWSGRAVSLALAGLDVVTTEI